MIDRERADALVCSFPMPVRRGRFGPYFVEPIVCGLEDKKDEKTGVVTKSECFSIRIISHVVRFSNAHSLARSSVRDVVWCGVVRRFRRSVHLRDGFDWRTGLYH